MGSSQKLRGDGMAKRTRDKKIEFSKVILILSIAINLAVILFSCVMIARTNDLSPLMYLIPATAADVATGLGFYYNKAKAENKIKLMKENNIQLTKQTFDDFGGDIL